MKECRLISSDDRGQVLAARPLSNADISGPIDSKSAISILWDSQTKAELSESELNQYAAARRLVRKQNYTRALAILTDPRPTHCEGLNLLGLIHEALGEFDQARRCYGEAGSVDADSAAAEMNARRMYELYTFGHSDIPLYL